MNSASVEYPAACSSATFAHLIFPKYVTRTQLLSFHPIQVCHLLFLSQVVLGFLYGFSPLLPILAALFSMKSKGLAQNSIAEPRQRIVACVCFCALEILRGYVGA